MADPRHEDDPHDDAAMVDLLRRWGRQIRRPDRSAAGEPAPSNLFARRRDVQAMIAGGNGTAPRALRLWVGLALAAAVLLAIGTWWFAQQRGGGTPAPVERRLALSDLRLSTSASVLRGPAEGPFRSGDRLYLHLAADHAGHAFVATLDPAMELAIVPRTLNIELAAGANVLGPFVLDESAGRETMIIAARAEPISAADAEALIDAAAAAARGAATHDAALAGVLEVMERIEPDGWSAGAVEIRRE